MNISSISISVEIEGKAYFVRLPEGARELVLKMIAGLSDNSALNVVQAPEGFEFAPINKLNQR